MAILKQRAADLAIHGGGPPAFELKVPLFAPHVGDSSLFAKLAEEMFLHPQQGVILDQFEREAARYFGVRKAIGFSSLAAALEAAQSCAGSRVSIPALGSSLMPDSEFLTPSLFDGDLVAAEPNNGAEIFDISHFGISAGGCESPFCRIAHQSIGNRKLVSNGPRLWAVELGKDQILHAQNGALVLTDDDLLAFRVLGWRGKTDHRLTPVMSDAASAMALANLSHVDRFISDNIERFCAYEKGLSGLDGVRLLAPLERPKWNHQAIVVEISRGTFGASRDAVFAHLIAENISAGKPFENDCGLPLFAKANRVRSRLLQLPNGPGLSVEDIAAICRVIELSAVSGLESPDPFRIAA